jgi:hypothetical protein
MTDHQAYPTALSTANLITTGYISTLPTDPSASAPCTTGAEAGCYYYAPLGTCNDYHLGAKLEDATNAALKSAPHLAASGTVCTGTINNTANSDFDGTAAGVYDHKP